MSHREQDAYQPIPGAVQHPYDHAEYAAARGVEQNAGAVGCNADMLRQTTDARHLYGPIPKPYVKPTFTVTIEGMEDLARRVAQLETIQSGQAERRASTFNPTTVQHGYSHTWEDLDRFTVMACTCGAEFRGSRDWEASGAFNSHIRAMIETAIESGGDVSTFVDADGQVRTHESYRAELQRVYDNGKTWNERAISAEAENAELNRQIEQKDKNAELGAWVMRMPGHSILHCMYNYPETGATQFAWKSDQLDNEHTWSSAHPDAAKCLQWGIEGMGKLKAEKTQECPEAEVRHFRPFQPERLPDGY